MTTEAESLAAQLWAVARAREQSARTVPSDATAEQVRRHVRALAAAEGIRIRTARVGDTVVVVRLDAKVWSDDAATMRRKLTPEAPERAVDRAEERTS